MNYIAVTLLHLSRHELYRMHPGLFYDMVQIRNNSIKKQENKDID